MAEHISSYRLEGEIARGGMGIVYRAVHTVFDEVVAIKAIFPELTLNPELRARFVNEAKIQRRLPHPNIVQIREFLIDQERFYIVMEFIEGETLAERLRRLGAPMLANEALDIFRQALRGLAVAHSQGVIHRDIKPSNIMLTRDGVAKLTDFGIARAVGVPGLTRTGTALGTPAYMAPEQIQGHKVDQRSDIYSLGVTLYEMVAGRVPFEKPKDSDSDFQVLRAHIEEPPRPPTRVVATIPPFVEGAILRAMAKRPDERFASCQAFEAALVHQELPTTRKVVPTIQPSVASTPAAPARRGIPKAELPQRAPAKAKIRAGHLWALLVLAVAIGVVGYWLYRVRPGPSPTVTPSPTGELPATKQSPPAAELAAQVQSLIKQANLALDRGEYDAAIAAYRRALQVDATNQEARRGIDRAQSAKAAELSPVAAQQRPYTVEDLKRLAQAGVTEKRLLDLVKQRGVGFSPTPEVLEELGRSGVPLSVLGEIRELIPPYRPYALKQTLTGHEADVDSVAFSPDGRLLVAGSPKTIMVWDVTSASLEQTLSGHLDMVSVALSPNGHFLASADWNKSIGLWDVASGALKQTLSGHRAPVYSVAFSPDGRLLASGSADKTIKLWDVASGALMQTLDERQQPVSSGGFYTEVVRSVAFSPDGRLLASGSSEKTIKLWQRAQ
ncbi:MAG TPA: protein kinase [Terriglobia bacterium]|nr:protein kinase [Terriglobia bacterium]